MAVSFAALTAEEIALAAADKPILASTPDPDQLDAGWETGTISGTLAGATDDAANRPAERAWDGLPGLQTLPDATFAANTLVMESSVGIEFDFVAYLNHNFFTIGATTVTLQVADDTGFTTNVRSLSTLNPAGGSTDRRLADLSLFHTGGTPLRYSGVQFMRLQISSGGSLLPKIGQVILGRRRQLKHEPNRPWDPTDLYSSLDRFESRGGSITDTPRFLGRREIHANLNPDASPHVQDLVDWYAGIQYGRLPLVWFDRPTGAPNDFYFMKMIEPNFQYPYIAPFVREFNLNAVEQGPNFFTQDP